MSQQLITTSNADRDLYAGATVLSTIADASNPRLCYVMVKLGDGTKNVSGAGGDFSVTVTIGGNTWNGGAQTRPLGSAVRPLIQTEAFFVPAGDTVTVVVTSPNSADTDVDCTAYLISESSASSTSAASILEDTGTTIPAQIAALSIPTAAAIADAVWDEATSGHATVGSYGASVVVINVDYTWTNNGSGADYDEVTITRT